METDEKEPTKEPRVRKKMLKNKLLQQMEFYFSDANLRNDKYMLELLNNDTNNYVLIEEFMTWNRIKLLTTNVRDLVDALENSAHVELSTDGLYVHRKYPMKDKEDPDECSIYIEQVKSSANHKWLTTVFSHYGLVDYVSIPKYKSGENKGFAFVEFGTPEAAQRALEEFDKAECVIPYTRPGPPLSFSLFEKEEETDNNTTNKNKYKATQINKNNKSHQSCDKNKPKAPLIGPSLPVPQPQFKSKISEKMDVQDTSSDSVAVQSVISGGHSENTKPGEKTEPGVKAEPGEKTEPDENREPGECDEMACEPVVTEEQKVLDVSEQLDSVHVSPKRKSEQQVDEPPVKKGKFGENTPQGDGNETKVVQPTVSRKAKRKRIQRTWKKKQENMIKDIHNTGLIIMAKKEWKRLRNKYLTIQRANMNKLKKKLHEARVRNKAKQVQNEKVESAEAVAALIKAKAAGTDTQRKLDNMETPDYFEYAAAAMGVAAQAASMGFVPVLPAIPGLPGFPQPPTPPPSVGSTSEQEQEKKKEKLPYKQGIIVKIQTTDPIYNRKMFKRSVRSVADVKYIEVKEGLSEAYVRCRDPDQATTFIQAGHWMYMNILTGEEEADFWQRYDLEKEAWQREHHRGIYHEHSERGDNQHKHKSRHKKTSGESLRRGREKILQQAENMNIDYTVTEDGIICLDD